MLQHRVNQKLAVAVIYICAMLMNSIDATVVNVALPTLSHEFGVSSTEIEAVIIGYLVSLAVFIPTSGWLGDRFGTKRIFLLALGIFTIASALCGFSSTLNELIFFRVLQGAGGGLLTPVGMAMLYRTFPPEDRVGVSRILMFATILGPASGPVLGGLIIEHWSWHWIFFINIPVGLIALIFGYLCLQDHKEPTAGRFDLPGFLLAGSGFGLVMYALSEGPSHGWTDPVIAGCLIGGLAILAVFVWVELRVAHPMVDLRLLSNRLFRRMSLVSICGIAAFLGTLFVVPLFLQEARGLSPLESGLATFPEAIGVVVSAQIVARIYPSVGPRRLMAGGLLGVALSAVLLSTMGESGSVWLFRFFMFTLGVGMAYVFLPNQVASMATISRADTGRASMLYSVQRQIGSAIGVAALSSVLRYVGTESTSATGVVTPDVAGYQAAFLVAAGIAVIGAVLALRIPDSEAAITMTRKQPRRSQSEQLAAVD